MTSNDRKEPTRLLLTVARVWLPVGLAIGGVVLIVIGGARVKSDVLQSNTAAYGLALVIIAMIVWMINWLFRMSIESNRDREREEEARRHFDRTGKWPDG
jgi:heme A synthase